MLRTAALLLFTSTAIALPPATPLHRLSGDQPCDRCTGYLLPGNHQPSPHTVYRIDSDLPEIYSSNGVLYTTRPVLPPFDTHSDGPLGVDMRTQVNNGFTTINDSFEVFLYHLSVAHTEGETRRIVVLVENESESTHTLVPRQVVLHGPNAARHDSVESILAERVLLEQWDRPFDPIELQPGQHAVIGHTLQLGAKELGPDGHPHPFVNGILRCDVLGIGSPNLVVSVISIPGDIPPAQWAEVAIALREVGANSAETSMDLRTPPPECHVRRVVGTAPNVLWQNEPIVIDVATLPQDDTSDDLYFQMAKFAVQSQGCIQARQSVDMLLSPPYVHSDSVGNYMMEYYLDLQFINTADIPRTFDLQFGKDDAPIGLAWQMSIAEQPTPLQDLESLPVTIDWAGPGRVEGPPHHRKTMLPDGPITLAPQQTTHITTRLMVIGTSSLPWQLHIVPVAE